MMDISREDWDGFFDAFSQEHQSRIVTIDTHGPDNGIKREFNRKPLEGITVSLKGHAAVITIIVQDEGGTHALHTVSAPQRLRVERTQEGQTETLQIEHTDGAATIIRLDRTEVPQAV